MEFPFCPDVARYDKITRIGQGTFGYVNLAPLLFRHLRSERLVLQPVSAL